MKNFLRKNISTIVFALLAYFGISWYQSKDMRQGPIAEAIKDSSFPTLSGEQARIWHESKVTLLYVFAPWCGVCELSASNINHLESSGIYVTALALSWQDEISVENFLEKSGLTTQVILGSENLASYLGLQAFPSYYLIDKQGTIVSSWAGYTSTISLWFRTRIASW